MDYHDVHGHDVASFDTTGTHRLPPIDASQALEQLEDEKSQPISTGITKLDKILLDTAPFNPASLGGIQRGQVTEVWGPPGSGRTALGIQLTANALKDGQGVAWIDCFQKLQSQRLAKVLHHINNNPKSETNQNEDGNSIAPKLGKFSHYSCFTLAHFMALVSKPASKAFDPDVSLIVISSVSALINSALPRSHEPRTSGTKNSGGPSVNAKRLQAIQFIITSLQKLAATKKCTVVILSQCATKMQADRSAALIPAINTALWEQGTATKIVLFRNWLWRERKASSVFLAGVQKRNGRKLYDNGEHVCAFQVNQAGISGVAYDPSQLVKMTDGQAASKRKLGQTELEVPDSEDEEDYGWDEGDDAALPPPPPQWQGSEDIILGQDVGHSDSEQEQEADNEYYYEDEDEADSDDGDGPDRE
ncbi:hypothetical protein VHEMI03600 [[Torrubiella] hemipterigena]|uniref:RecA family profile 1 domain-containing protein n=1 Tax=[Torrubiella] hemipterigena TaxID=1531966 RepID=A0A0A1SYZ2_9HYPO|nr:hypothetical protein VHEMI03600 [[Torrubiella] hemipterigena]